MSKAQIDQVFEKLKESGDKAFISYIMAGDGGLDGLKHQIKTLEAAGVDIIELGIPFSDPVADGPVIQQAGIRALDAGVSLRKILDELKKIKDDINVPIVLMTYINPVLNIGYQAFAEDARNSGVSGVILPDVPFEEEDEISTHLGDNDIALVRLVTLTSDEGRIRELCEGAEGFLYAVTVKGTTGGRTSFGEDTYELLRKIKGIADVPVCAGFGVSNREMAEALGDHCDGVIVGSKIVEMLHQGEAEGIKNLIPEKSSAVK
ncbi:tryptophan synthase subunit alpha [Lacicoccus alkaliphilus]|uniref:Tryptophan synthase alpha chain n=1 Tax=Lacicoccus alkaliphilus DSM 16010 TaxID=1123231 RepID=A0A1M7FLH2_9BACL|nr:tryptophan synthase subunit alpha [Salinicoccus alkaliphilus]SHM04942.1 tryptophan synthase, alpha chain [Salinicoccus alkaliphilus DSM 16010]